MTIEIDIAEVEKNLQKVRAYTAIKEPFFGTLILRANMTLSTSIGTGATDGKDFLINPSFWYSLTKEERIFLLCHEVMHKALMHHTRRGNRDPRTWNMACDYAINQILVDANLTMIKGGLLDPKYREQSADKIYEQLKQEQEQQEQPGNPDDKPCEDGEGGEGEQQQPGEGEQQQPGEGEQQQPGDNSYTPGSEDWDFGSVQDMPTDGENPQAEIQQEEQTCKTELQEAGQVAKMAGKLPAGMKRIIDQTCEPVVNWKAELQDFFDSKAPTDFSFQHRNRRYSGAVVMPGYHSEALGSIIFAVDTSGSVTEDELQQFAGEIIAVYEDLEPEELHVIWCDYKVANTQTFERGEYVDHTMLHPAGGGGTRFSPVFKWAEENANDVCALVYLTDGYCNDFGEEPPFPVLWALTEKNRRWNPPFGQTIYCIMDK